MSCYEWERGTIKLPTAAVAGVKKAVRDAVIGHRNEVERICKRWWQDNKTSSVKKYDERLSTLDRDIQNYTRQSDEFWEPVLYTLQSVCDRHWNQRTEARPRQVQQKDLDRQLGPKPTSRTTNFECGESTITFNGSTVTWNVPEGNRACESAHDHPVARAFFTALRSLTWTRGSGGEIIGNNEYNRDTDYAGGGANYVAFQFGPKVTKALAGRRW